MYLFFGGVEGEVADVDSSGVLQGIIFWFGLISLLAIRLSASLLSGFVRLLQSCAGAGESEVPLQRSTRWAYQACLLWTF